MRLLAIIPARSGSKGLKDKNVMDLAGKPLLAYSVEAAKNSGLFDTVHVSTDSQRYANIAREYGADVPFLRSEEMSSDNAGTWETVVEVLEKYKTLGKMYDAVVLLQPTSPLRKSDDIIEAYNIFVEKNANAVVSVCETDHSPLLVNTLSDDGSMDGFLADSNNVQRQNFETYYRINGAVYIVKIPYLLSYMNIYMDKSYAYVMPKQRSIDIDTKFDFDMVEFFISHYNF